MPAFLIDTWDKNAGNLLDWMDVSELAAICERGREARITVALAGSLKREQILKLMPIDPEVIAVRAAACVGGRNGTVSRERVAELVGVLSAPC
jgi:uncharacterized protein (UPF0264 family)